MADNQVYLMPFSHLDLFWLGEREECLSRGNRIISLAMAICQKEPSFRFLLEDMVFVKNYLISHPEKKGELAQLVAEGRIEVAPKYAGIYANMIPGEAHVRNLMYGKALARDLLGADPQVAHQGDLPAHTPQYPQILRKSGVPCVVLSRLAPNHTPLFHWQGLDGSRVLSWYSARSYAWGLRLKLHEGAQAARASGLEQEARAVLSQTSGPILMHWGVDLVLPTEQLVRTVEEWNRGSGVKLRFSTPSEFFRAVEDTPNVPVVQGESPNGWGLHGSDCAPTDARYLDGQAVASLQNGERFATIASLLGYVDYPGEALQTAWMRLLEAMDHNANGTGAEEGNRRHQEYRRLAIFAGQEVLRNSLRPIAENVAVLHGKESVPLVVFNGLSWARTDAAMAHVSFHGDISAFQRDQSRNFSLLDATGQAVPFQIVEDKAPITRELKLAFLAEEVPSVGYKTYYLVPAQEPPAWPETCQVTDENPNKPLVLEADQVTLELRRPGGQVSLYDKALGRWVLKDALFVGEETDLGKQTHRFEHHATGREFPLYVQESELVENGAVRARLVVRGMVGPVQVQQEWTLYRGLRRVDLTIVTRGEPIAAVLQQTFPTNVEGGKVNFGVPYGTNSFENVMPDLEPKAFNQDECNYDAWVNLREVQDWIDVSNKAHGVTLATDHRMMEVKAPVILGKLAYIRVFDEPRSYHFQICPHEGDWRAARSYRRGAELATPLTVLSVNDPFTEKSLPAEQSHCSISAENVVSTVLKRSQDGTRLIWRGYEAEGVGASMALRFLQPLTGLAKTNLLEVDEGPVAADAIPVGPNEIVTLAALPLCSQSGTA